MSIPFGPFVPAFRASLIILSGELLDVDQKDNDGRARHEQTDLEELAPSEGPDGGQRHEDDAHADNDARDNHIQSLLPVSEDDCPYHNDGEQGDDVVHAEVVIEPSEDRSRPCQEPHDDGEGLSDQDGGGDLDEDQPIEYNHLEYGNDNGREDPEKCERRGDPSEAPDLFLFVRHFFFGHGILLDKEK